MMKDNIFVFVMTAKVQQPCSQANTTDDGIQHPHVRDGRAHTHTHTHSSHAAKRVARMLEDIICIFAFAAETERRTDAIWNSLG